MGRTIIIVLAALAVAACGNKAALKPRQGVAPAPAPYGREEPLSADALLDPPQQAVPERSVELRRRSEEREDDPFDLPPAE